MRLGRRIIHHDPKLVASHNYGPCATASCERQTARSSCSQRSPGRGKAECDSDSRKPGIVLRSDVTCPASASRWRGAATQNQSPYRHWQPVPHPRGTCRPPGKGSAGSSPTRIFTGLRVGPIERYPYSPCLEGCVCGTDRCSPHTQKKGSLCLEGCGVN